MQPSRARYPAAVITLLAGAVALLVGVSIFVSDPDTSRTPFSESVAPAATPTAS